MYPGGKSKANHVLDVLNDPILNDKDYIEPFVGLAHVLYRVHNKRSYTASDDSQNVITLLQTLQEKHSFPRIEEVLYRKLKNQVLVNDDIIQYHSQALLHSMVLIGSMPDLQVTDTL